MIVGMAASARCGQGSPLGATDIKGNPAETVVSVGSVNLPLSLLDSAIAEQQQQQQLPADIMDSLPAEYQLNSVGGPLNQIIQAGHVYEYATRNGFKNDDDYVLEASHLKSEAEFKAYAKEALTNGGLLKSTSTDADFEKVIKEQTKGQSFSEVYKAQFEDLSKALKDPQKRMVAVMSVAHRSALEKLQKSIKPTEADVRKSYERFNVKRVYIRSDDKVTDAQAKQKADKAHAELKGGKSFEAIMDTYSDDAPDQGKKKSDRVMPLDQTMIDKVPDYAIIAKLQPATYSEPVKVTGGYAIYKYVGKGSDLPKDFDAKKKDYIAQYEVMESQRRFQTEIEKIAKEVEPKFEIAAYEAVYLFQKAQMSPAGAAQDEEFRKAYEKAKSVDLNTPGGNYAATVQVAAFQRIYDAPGADKAKLKPEYLAGLARYLEKKDNWAYRKEVIDGFKEAKDGEKAMAQLMIAVANNTKFDQGGQANFSDINAKFSELKTAGLVTTEMEKEFRTKQDLWRSEKQKYDEEEARFKKQQEEDKKAADAAAKANKTPQPPKK